MAFMKACLWVLIGAAFGLISFFSVFVSSAIFVVNNKTNLAAPNSEFIIFMCLALMSGAGADFVLSAHFNKKDKIILALVIIIFLGYSFYLFNPATSPKENAVYWSSIFYCTFGAAYCIWVKAVIFKHEIKSAKKSKYYGS